MSRLTALFSPFIKYMRKVYIEWLQIITIQEGQQLIKNTKLLLALLL